MVKQYGNWIYITENPDDSNVKQAYIDVLNEEIKNAENEGSINLSHGEINYIFKEVSDVQKLKIDFPVNERLWTAAWKVTIQ